MLKARGFPEGTSIHCDWWKFLVQLVCMPKYKKSLSWIKNYGISVTGDFCQIFWENAGGRWIHTFLSSSVVFHMQIQLKFNFALFFVLITTQSLCARFFPPLWNPDSLEGIVNKICFLYGQFRTNAEKDSLLNIIEILPVILPYKKSLRINLAYISSVDVPHSLTSILFKNWILAYRIEL